MVVEDALADAGTGAGTEPTEVLHRIARLAEQWEGAHSVHELGGAGGAPAKMGDAEPGAGPGMGAGPGDG